MNKNQIKYPFSKQLMFAKVMEDETLCRDMLGIIFPGRKVKDLVVHQRDRMVLPQYAQQIDRNSFRNGSPAVAGYEPTACQVAVECHTLKRCTPDRGLTSSSYFAGLSLPN